MPTLAHPLAGFSAPDLTATPLHPRRWAVRPAGQLGTCGWFPRPWAAVFVSAPTPADAIRRALKRGAR